MRRVAQIPARGFVLISLLGAVAIVGCHSDAALVPADPALHSRTGAVAAHVKSPEVTATDLDTAGNCAHSASASAINPAGQIVGSCSTSETARAVLWEDGVMTDLGTLGGAVSQAYDINAAGQVVGWSGRNDDPNSRAFLWEKGAMKDLGVLHEDGWSEAHAINAAGQVVGVASTGREWWSSHAVLWQKGVIIDLGTLGGDVSYATGINSAGKVVGYSYAPYDDPPSDYVIHAFLWDNGVMTDLGTLGGLFSQALAINAAGQVVGVSATSGDELHAFLWEKGVMRDLGTLGGGYSAALAINPAGAGRWHQ
jgi:probable HAF family extracellular repeat protein